ncbi:hypothetical protein ER308_20900 [Egibacter rhizosphaerae]|uniref:Carbon monoxide dehydrogenase n=1 Tax=Egibacter rhizosphaerae TaxID=1670831 RepID=A0A411YKQ0_9ACTN|nr:SRPBCC family protein [Egibacter rhizosphaerae]QBI21772.1 hypothetical protein ER308_20900 [Egibacter rhizosphaerae]
MQLEHSFTVPVGIDDAWEVLLDVERVAPCMPGATLTEVREDDFSGRVKVKVGPMQLTYKGTASFTETDSQAYRAQLTAKGQETRGSGTASATVTAQLTDQGGQTDVQVTTDLSVTGRPAQFGRGVMSEVGDKLLSQFADCLAERLAGAPTEEERVAAEGVHEERTAAAPAGGGTDLRQEPQVTPAAARMVHQDPSTSEDEAIDLIDVAGGSVSRRLGPVLGALSLIAAFLWFLRRRR